MGKRDRERIERILEGKENKFTNSNEVTEGMQKEILSRAQLKAHAIVDDKAKQWETMTLTRQVQEAEDMLKRTGITNFRKNFLPGFKEDLHDRSKQGHTNQHILDYYFTCDAFVKFWEKLQLTEVDFIKLLPQEKDITVTEPKQRKGIFNWVAKKKKDLSNITQAAQGNPLALESLLEASLIQKAERIKKSGREVTLELLMTKWESLERLGFTREAVEDKCKEILNEVKTT